MRLRKTNIWYADEVRAKSPKKLLFYSDMGSLTLERSGLKFNGEKTQLGIDNVNRIYLARPTLNWVTYLVGAFISVFLDLVVGSGMETFFETTWVLTKLYVGLAPLCILLFWLPMKWLVVEYKAGEKQRKAWFSLGDLNGFKGLFGGNKKLMKKLRESGLNHSQPR